MRRRSRARAASSRRPRGMRTPAGARATRTRPSASAHGRDQRQAPRRCAFSCCASSHMRAPQDLDAQVGERRCPPAFAAIGTSEWPVMPGDVFTSRNENVPSARRIRSSRPQPRQPTMSNAASDAARISRLLRVRQAGRAEVLRLVGEVLVVVVVVALRRLDADQRQRARR